MDFSILNFGVTIAISQSINFMVFLTEWAISEGVGSVSYTHLVPIAYTRLPDFV